MATPVTMAAPRAADKLKEQWGAKFEHLVGLTVTAIGYLSAEETRRNGWRKAPAVITLADGKNEWYLYPCKDDEGNDGGAIYIHCSNPEAQRALNVPEIAPTISDP